MIAIKTISQVAELTGISTRTLQYYDEIGLLKPSDFTLSGYRLYDDDALERLQQILFFKELDFKLKDIKEILQKPEYDKIEAFKRQKKLLILRQERTERLIRLLSRLEEGEQCMSFKEFDMSEYVEALEQFKVQNTEDVIKHWGSVENFNHFIQKIKDDQPKIAEMAIKQFGSVEKYTESMKYNLEHFSELMDQINMIQENKEDILQKSDELYVKLTSDLSKDAASDEIQDIVRQIMEFTQKNSAGVDLGEGYWEMVAEGCSHDAVKEITDRKYGAGASEYMAKALRYYLQKSLTP